MKINFLWIGDSINKMGQLSLKSFLDNGHEPVLWAYNKNCKNIPDGIKIEDAGQILHPDRVFSYNGNGDCRKNSYGGFSDIFRYYLLKEIGGWYSDMDVTCLTPFDNLKNDYVIRTHNNAKFVANIIKTPKNCDLINQCIEQTENIIDENNDEWVKPVHIFASVVKQNKMDNTECIAPKEFFGEDSIEEIMNYVSMGYFTNKFQLPKYAIHWCNEAISTGQWDSTIKRNLDVPVPTTLYYKLLKKHKLL